MKHVNCQKCNYPVSINTLLNGFCPHCKKTNVNGIVKKINASQVGPPNPENVPWWFGWTHNSGPAEPILIVMIAVAVGFAIGRFLLPLFPF